MRLWWRYQMLPKIRRRVELSAMWIAWRVPRWLAYWCTIRLAAHATQGPWSKQSVPELTCADALKRWERDYGTA